MTVTPTLLLATGMTSDNKWNLFALDKKTGARLGAVEIPGPTMYGLSSWMHEGRQYVIVQLNDGLAALALPTASPPPPSEPVGAKDASADGSVGDVRRRQPDCDVGLHLVAPR